MNQMFSDFIQVAIPRDQNYFQHHSITNIARFGKEKSR
jgi:hypothetical protein